MIDKIRRGFAYIFEQTNQTPYMGLAHRDTWEMLRLQPEAVSTFDEAYGVPSFKMNGIPIFMDETVGPGRLNLVFTVGEKEIRTTYTVRF